MRLATVLGEREVTLEAEPAGDGWRMSLPDGRSLYFSAKRLPGDLLEITTGEEGAPAGRTFRIPFEIAFAQEAQQVRLSYSGVEYDFLSVLPGRASRSRKPASGVLIAPMVGVVTSVMVTEGQKVTAYQPLVGIEAMKVVTLLDAPYDGTVRHLSVQVGQQVEHGAPIVEIEP